MINVILRLSARGIYYVYMRIESQKPNTRPRHTMELPGRAEVQRVPAWAVDLQQDLNVLLDQRVAQIEKGRATNPKTDELLQRVHNLRENDPIELQLISVMNNFRRYLPGYEDGGDMRDQVKQYESEAEDDPRMKEAIRESMRVLQAIDAAIQDLHISAEDLKKMRNSLYMDKKDPEYIRIIRLVGDLFYYLRAEGFSVKELNT